MQGISKRGAPYLRKQLIHGARALLGVCDKQLDSACPCLVIGQFEKIFNQRFNKQQKAVNSS